MLTTSLSAKPVWSEKNGIIHLSVTSDGTTGPEWIKRLEGEGYDLSGYAKRAVLESPDFIPTFGVTTRIVIPRVWVSEKPYTCDRIYAEAQIRRWTEPNVETACLIRMALTDAEIEEWGFCRILVMHKPIRRGTNDPVRLYVYTRESGKCLRAYVSKTGYKMPDDWGFAFEVPEGAPCV